MVADIRLQSRQGLAAVWEMSLDRTEFQAGDRGTLEAVTRSGTRLEIPVTAVLADSEGIVWHVVEKPLAAGTDVTGVVSASNGA